MREIMLQEFDENRERIFLHSTGRTRAELEQLQQATRESLGNFVNALVHGLSRDFHAAIVAPQLRRLSAAQVKIRHEVGEFVKEADAQLHLEEVVETQIHQAPVLTDDAENASDIMSNATDATYIKPEENIDNMFQ